MACAAKKGRTILTTFAGSIGIIGIALILAVSQGTSSYINYVQESTLSAYPITLEEEAVDLTALMESFMNVGNGDITHEKDAIYKDQVIGELVNALAKTETSEKSKRHQGNEKLFRDNKLKRENSYKNRKTYSTACG